MMTRGEEMYPEMMVVPMREELTRLGIEELRTAADVDRAIPNQSGTTMVVVNSICGCAAGRMRPAVRAALQHSSRPEKVVQCFCRSGQRRDRAGSLLFCRISAIFSVDCAAARRQGGPHDAAQRHRTSRGGGHRRRTEEGVFDKFCAKPAPVDNSASSRNT